MNIKPFVFSMLMLIATQVIGQGRLIDQVVAVVNDEPILESDIYREIETARAQMEINLPDSAKYDILSKMIGKKMLLAQAHLDSVVVSNERIEAEMERKMRFFLMQFNGDEKEFEKYLGKTIVEFKAQNKQKMKEQMMIQEVEGKILRDVRITPNEVRKFFKSIPVDSLPLIDVEVEVAQIMRKPKISEGSKSYAYDNIKRIRDRIIDGEDFAAMAIAYSEDPGSSGKGGETGWFGRGKMVPEFEGAAFKLRPDSISRIIETMFGYHILKLIDRRGENINVRHILVRPKTVRSDVTAAKYFLDSLLFQIKADSITFEEAAKKYSDDEFTKANGGRFVDEQTGSPRVPISQLERDVLLAIEDMKPGDLKGPLFVREPDGDEVFKIYKLVSQTKPHRANMNDDYQRLQMMALAEKRERIMEEWYRKNRRKFYIKIDEEWAQNPALQRWNLNK